MTRLHGFEKRREEHILEIGCTAWLYRHEKTGAELLSLAGEDENKVFGVSFRTPPADSTGIAHIMEHSVLCGSRKYPVKAPFLEMLKSSLNSFLNAMTFPDKTVYPVASTNLQDFYNLVEVYLDAVFHPRITREILEQEGWHYELESPEALLIYKGVVFNEMKGSYSSPENRVYRLSQQSIYPDTTYGVDSGGDPKEIPKLTYDAFKAFHERCYHPSNAQFFFYGDDDPEKRLEILNAVLEEFSAIDVDTRVPLQPRFDAPRKSTVPLPASEKDQNERQARVTVNWMLDAIKDPEKALAWTILHEILVGTIASPLRKALIDSRLGDDLTATGLNSSLQQMRFGAGLKGINPDDTDKVEALILQTLSQLAEHGIDPMTVESSLNTVEFRLRENNAGHYPRGLRVMFWALQFWNYGHDPFASLAWAKPLESLKTRLSNGERLFEALIRKELVDNHHRTTLIFTPDSDLSTREAREEREQLDQVKAAMTAGEIQGVIEETRRLKELQQAPDSPEALASIPRLTLKALPKKQPFIPAEISEHAGAQILTHDLPANGVVYIDIALDLRKLPADLLPYTGLLKCALLETGTAGQTMVELLQRIGRSTGGLSSHHWTSSIIGSEHGAARLLIRAKSTPEKAGELVSILTDVLLAARLDERARVEQIIGEERAHMEARLVPAGSQIATTRMGTSLTEAGWAAEQINGVSYLSLLREISAKLKENSAEVCKRLAQMRDLLVRRDAMVFNITGEASDLRRVEPEIARLVEAMPPGAVDQPEWLTPKLPRFEGLTMPAKVNYVVKGENLHQLGHKAGGSALVSTHWLRGAWLWEKIRVQGGAYGGFCTLDMRSGNFNFASYRDPNLLETIAIYDGAAAFLRSIADSEADLERAMIGTIGVIDTYHLPDAKGLFSLMRHVAGEGYDRLQTIRDEVLSTKSADIRAFADALDAVATHGRVVVLGSEEAIQSANAQLDDRFTLTKVL
jgi:Zn-dependent M16 (insulinase) family peptidase